MSAAAELRSTEPPAPQIMRLFLCGDVMLGRGIDQALPHPCAWLFGMGQRGLADVAQIIDLA